MTQTARFWNLRGFEPIWMNEKLPPPRPGPSLCAAGLGPSPREGPFATVLRQPLSCLARRYPRFRLAAPPWASPALTRKPLKRPLTPPRGAQFPPLRIKLFSLGRAIDQPFAVVFAGPQGETAQREAIAAEGVLQSNQPDPRHFWKLKLTTWRGRGVLPSRNAARVPSKSLPVVRPPLA